MNRQQGFTIPELVVVMTLSGMFLTIILLFTFNYWRFGASLDSSYDTLVTRLNAGDFLRQNIGESSGLANQNSIPDANANAPDNTIPGGQYWEPIHAIPGNKTLGNSGYSPLLYFRQFTTTTSGTVAMNGTQPYEDEMILYFDNTKKQLLARTLANTNVANNRAKTSCPPAQASVACPADKIVASDLASVDMRYFSRAGNLLDYTSQTDSLTGQYIGPDYPVVEVVEFTLNLTQKPFLQTTSATQNSTIIRIALRDS